MNFSKLDRDQAKRKIQEAEQLIQEISLAKLKIKKTGALLRRHLNHTMLYCKST